jgi:hypothetical protein
MLKRLLEDRGIKVGGVARELSLPPGPPAGETRVLLAEHLSIPLGQSVKLVNKISQNLHTEMLLRTAARQDGIWATPEDLVNSAQNFYATAGIPAEDVVQTDGSGLSRHDLVTQRAWVDLLHAQCRGCGVHDFAGGGYRWHAGRPNEKQYRGRTLTCEDRVGGACADTPRVCRATERTAASVFLH